MNILLIDLEPEWVQWIERPATEEDNKRYGTPVGQLLTLLPNPETFAEAQGIVFNCPVCIEAKSHMIQIAFRDRGVADHHGTRNSQGVPTRWAASGTDFRDLTLTPSVDCTPSNPKCWHGFITNGVVT